MLGRKMPPIFCPCIFLPITLSYDDPFHGWEGFDGRGQGYEIDMYVDGQPIHVELTFRSGWIVIKDPQSTGYYGFHLGRLRGLHVALNQFVAMEDQQGSNNATATK